MNSAARKTKFRRTRKSKFLLSQAQQNALLRVCFPQQRGKTRWRMRGLKSAALGRPGEHHCPPLCPCPAARRTRQPPELVSVGSLSQLCWEQRFGHLLYLHSHFYSITLPGGCVFTPHSTTGLAVPSCCWLDLSLKLEVSNRCCLYWKVLHTSLLRILLAPFVPIFLSKERSESSCKWPWHQLWGQVTSQVPGLHLARWQQQ